MKTGRLHSRQGVRDFFNGDPQKYKQYFEHILNDPKMVGKTSLLLNAKTSLSDERVKFFFG